MREEELGNAVMDQVVVGAARVPCFAAGASSPVQNAKLCVSALRALPPGLNPACHIHLELLHCQSRLAIPAGANQQSSRTVRALGLSRGCAGFMVMLRATCSDVVSSLLGKGSEQ